MLRKIIRLVIAIALVEQSAQMVHVAGRLFAAQYLLRSDTRVVSRLQQSLFKILEGKESGNNVMIDDRGVGDVLLSWENKAYLVEDKFGKSQFDTVFS